MKKKILFFLSFFLPIIIFLLSNIIAGNKLRFVSNLADVSAQYVPLFKYYKGIISFDNSIFYSFYKGLGGNMFSTYFYYLSCPLNVLIYFFDDIDLFINFLCLLKIGLCGFTMYVYLNTKNKNKCFYNLIFALCYALMGYNICYVKNFFWFDVVYMAPIVLLGIDKLINKGDSKLYVFSLAFCIYCNFYLAFSLCIFCIIYYFYQVLFYNNKKGSFKIFIVSSLLCGAICSFFLIPTLLDIFQLKNRTGIDGLFNADYQNIIFVFYRCLIGSSDIIFHNLLFVESPNLYCSLFILLILLFFFFDSKVAVKEKIFVFLINLFFLLSVFFKPLYYMWHGFSYTNGNPFRFSYLWSLFNILVVYKYFINFSFINVKKVFIILLFIFYFNFLLFYYKSGIFFNGGFEIIISLVFIIIYFFLLYFKKSDLFFLIVIIFELFINCLISYDLPSSDNKSFNYNCLNFSNDYVRVNNNLLNSSLYCSYGSSSFYLTTTNVDVVSFFSKSGSNAYKLHVFGLYDTDLINSLLGIDYLLFDDYNYSVYNDNSLSIGYMVYDNKLKFNNAIEFQESLLNSMINDDKKYFVEYPFEKISDTEFIYHNDGYVKYFYIDFDNFRITKLYVNDKEMISNLYDIYNHIVKIPSTDDIVKIKIVPNCLSIDNHCNYKFKIYELDNNSFNDAIDILKQQQLVVTKIDKNVLEGNIDVLSDDQMLFLSIPYERGWNIYVDGKKHNYEKIYNSFIGIKLDKGYHEIKMYFSPYGFKFSIFVSSFSILLYFAFCKYLKNK